MRLLIALILLLGTYTLAHAEDYVVIVNSDGPLVGIDNVLIRDIYLGDKRFFGEVALVPISYGEGPLKDLFLKERVKMTPKEYKLHWLKKVFQEGLKIPRSIDSDFDIVEFVRREKGAVAYLPASSAAIADDIEGVLVIEKRR